MRKYFLFSAVALMISSTVNATTDYAEVTAKATIEVAGTFECSDLDFGTIVVKQNNQSASVSLEDLDNGDIAYDDIISYKDYSWAHCSHSNYLDGPTSVTLRGTNTDNVINVSRIDISGDNTIDATLNIPAKVVADEYTGSFTVTATY